MTLSIEEIQHELKLLAAGNEEYAVFNRRIVNTQKTVLGVRVPDLRKLAKKLAKQCTADDIAQYIDSLDKSIFEQVLLAGMIINQASMTDREAITLAGKYLQLVDSWAEVDIFASKRKTFDEEKWWAFAVSCLTSRHEFTVRYGVIEMMANYINEKYIESVYTHLRGIQHEGYYVKMGMAWLYATAAVKFYRRTSDEIVQADIDRWTKGKSLQKMLESYQFSKEQKEEIRKLRGSLGAYRKEFI